jgi:hypothetical protein
VLSITDTSLVNKKIPKGGNQNPYIEEGQTTQCQKKKYKRTNNDLGNEILNDEKNTQIFVQVQKFIQVTGRFTIN